NACGSGGRRAGRDGRGSAPSASAAPTPTPSSKSPRRPSPARPPATLGSSSSSPPGAKPPSARPPDACAGGWRRDRRPIWSIWSIWAMRRGRSRPAGAPSRTGAPCSAGMRRRHRRRSPGQGAQYPGMGLGLYRTEPVFREEMDRASEILRPRLGCALRELLADGRMESEDTAFVQPALFAFEHALARLWMSWGIRPQAVIGHSLGEYVAACVAGAFSFEDGLALVAERGRLLGDLPHGAMASLPLSEEEVAPLLAGGLSLAAVNAPAQCVVSGSEEEVRGLLERLAVRGVAGRRLRTSHAFHSAMVEPAVAPFLAA